MTDAGRVIPSAERGKERSSLGFVSRLSGHPPSPPLFALHSNFLYVRKKGFEEGRRGGGIVVDSIINSILVGFFLSFFSPPSFLFPGSF